MKKAIHGKATARLRHALIAAALAGASAAASAAPYAITYQGTMGAALGGIATLPGINVGESYTVTFVFDNGGTSANAQTWTPANLTCAIWQMNSAKNVVFVQDLVATPPTASAGSVTTDATGALTAVFGGVAGSAGPGSYTTSGITLSSVIWYANNGNDVFYESAPLRSFTDTSGGVQMNIAKWSNPQPFTGSCNAASFAPLNTTTSAATVPTLGEWSLALLALTAAGFGATRLRRRG